MKIFVSWSGEPSQGFAIAFSDWIKMVIQSAEPFMSSTDIRSGHRWLPEIGKQLETSAFGVICLTRRNKEEPWILFEAGALSKFLDASAVVPLRIDIDDNAEITLPLSQFQSRGLSKGDMLSLVRDINDACSESKLDSLVLEKTFERFWPDLDQAIQATLSDIKASGGLVAKRPTDEMIEETLNTVRALASNIETLKGGFLPRGSAAARAAAGLGGFGAVPPPQYPFATILTAEEEISQFVDLVRDGITVREIPK